MQRENRLWQRMRVGIAARCFHSRIENGVGSGEPDVVLHCRTTGVCAWVELKAVGEYPKRASTRVFGDKGLRPEQVAWIYCRAMVGARVWIVGEVGNDLYVVHGVHARAFNSMTRADLHAAAVLVVRARGTQWGEVCDVLLPTI